MLYWLLKLVGGPILKRIWVREVRGLAELPAQGPLILAANHDSYFDFLVLAACLPRRVYFLAAEKFFTSPFWAPLAYGTRQIRVDRLDQDKSRTYEQALGHLRRGQIIGIFPEGRRSDDGRLAKGFPGAVRLSLMSGAPILPAGLTGTYQILPRQKRFPRLNKCVLTLGQLWQPSESYPDYQPAQESQTRLAALTEDLMARISRLVEPLSGPETAGETVAAAKPSGRPAIAFFDVDNTIVAGLTLQILMNYLKQQKVISARDYWRNIGGFILYKLGLLKNPAHLRSSALNRLLKSRAADSLDQVFARCFEEKIKPRIYPGAVKLIRQHQARGEEVILVSASMDRLVGPLAGYLGVDGWRASEPEVIDNRFTGRLKTRSPWREEKSRVIRELAERQGLDLSRCYFYSDHISDLPALETVGRPVGLNPDRSLRRICRARDWPVIRLDLRKD